MRINLEKTGEIGTLTATAISLNAIIGAGPFGAPTTLADNNGLIALCTYAFTLITVWAVSFSLSRVAYLYPQPGSFYAYVTPWGGHILGIIAVTAYLISTFTAMAIILHIASEYFVHMLPIHQPTVGYIILVLSLMLNIYRIRFSQISQLILLAGTVFLFIATIVTCLLQADWRNLIWPEPFSWFDIFTPSYSVIFGFLGFEAATALHNIVISPKTSVPRAITYSITCAGVLYLVYVASLVIAIPRQAFEKKPVLLTTLLHYISPHTWVLTYAIHGALLFAIVGTIHATTWSSAVLLRTTVPSYPRNGRFWENLSIVITTCIIAMSYTFLHNIDFGLRLTVLLRGSVYTLALITLLSMPREWLNYHNYIATIALAAVSIVLYFAIV